MRGLGNVFKGAVFLAGLLGLSASAFAQKDPQTSVYLDNVTICSAGYTFDVTSKKCVKGTDSTVTDDGRKLTTVTLSRPPELTTYAAYDLFVVNNTTNSLNRLYFTLTVIDSNGSASDNPSFNKVITLDNPEGKEFSCTSTPTATQDGFKLDCTSNISLNPDTGYMKQHVVVVVATPSTGVTGTTLTVTGTAGGYEGNSQTGNGCCASPLPEVKTTLVDSTSDTTFSYTLNAITFVKGDESSQVFTGNKGVPNRSDPFTTDVTVAPFEVPTGKKYDIGQIVETPKPASQGTRCKSGNLFRTCYQTQVSLPQVFYAPPSDANSSELLTVILKIHPSLIKGSQTNFNLDAVQVAYTNDDQTETTTLPSCAGTSPVVYPCLFSKSYDGVVITLTIKNTKNGFLEFF